MFYGKCERLFLIFLVSGGFFYLGILSWMPFLASLFLIVES